MAANRGRALGTGEIPAQDHRMSQLSGTKASFRMYWSAHGGWKALGTSPQVYVAILLALAMAPTWLAENWWETVLSVMPNVRGFSLGGFAIFLALGDDGFRRLIAGKDHEDADGEARPFLSVPATFLHFIIVQLLAIVASLLARSWYAIKLAPNSVLLPISAVARPVWWFLGFVLFICALSAAAAAGMAVFRLAGFFDSYVGASPPAEPPSCPCGQHRQAGAPVPTQPGEAESPKPSHHPDPLK